MNTNEELGFKHKEKCRVLPEAMMKQFVQIQTLKPGWYADAPVIQQSVCRVAQFVLEQLKYDMDPNVCPSDDGSIDVTWHDRELYLTIDNEGFVYNDGAGQPTQFHEFSSESTDSVRVNKIVEILQPLLDRKLDT